MVVAAAVTLFSRPLTFSGAEELESVAKSITKPWDQPHQLRIAGSKLVVDSVSQGSHWQSTISEPGGGASIFATGSDDDKVEFGLHYDSSKSSYNVPDGPLKKVAFSAAGDSEDFDWSLELDGKPGQHFAVTGNGKDIVYDGTLAMEYPVREGLTGLYAIDFKKREGTEGFLPTWASQGAGLRYASKVGDLKLSLHQPKLDSGVEGLEYEAVLTGKLAGVGDKGSKVLSSDPQYIVRAADGKYRAALRAPGRKGLSFGIDMDGSSASGYTAWEGNREVVDGIQVSGDVKVVANGKEGEQPVSVQPIGFGAQADLAKFLPKVAQKGSRVAVRGRYKPGAERPAVAVVTDLRAEKLRVQALANMDDRGKASAGMQVSASSNGFEGKYEVSTNEAQVLRQAAEFKLPAKEIAGGASARATGRFFQGGVHGDKPRLQLGVQYEASASIQGRQVKIGGASALDSGRRLLDEMGRPWSSPSVKKARNTASVLRKRIQGEYGQGHQWLRK
eukprot:TRINITY_DN1638_c0_g1_i2.p1 TRINITY_DN1638_c0_g1~~TRINITY_DN1638_c0_g1_i2.p1  ORF type:complete len:542 (-),score=116.14 TRINITY_DN1638_c0_g1_i2:266-1774(-)